MASSLDQLIAVTELAESRFTVTFDDQTVLWSVNGGYIAAAALRVAEKASKFARPASVSCQYLRTLKPGPVEAVVTVITAHSSAQLLQIDFHQDGKHRVLALVWTVARKDGPAHSAMHMPVVPHPDELRKLEDIMRPDEPPVLGFWNVFEQRPINRIDWQARVTRTPRFFRWFRYVSPLDASSQFAVAAGYLPIIDIMGVVSAGQMYDRPFLRTLAPTIQLTTQFYDVVNAGEWFLSDSFCEQTSDGLIPARVKIWSVTGRLLAHGFTQMVTREGTGAYLS